MAGAFTKMTPVSLSCVRCSTFLTAGSPYDLRFRRNLEPRAQRGEPVTSTSLRYHSENIFMAPNKTIRLLNKRGFCSDGDGWSCAGRCDGARVKPGVAKVMCHWGKGSDTRADTRRRGKYIHQLINWRNKYYKQLQQSTKYYNKQNF